MQYITQEYFDFFQELEQNNHKDWFDINRERYENHVKKPFEKLVEKLAIELAQIDDHAIIQTPNQCIFRINRDIRFSKDKTPYKLHRAAVFGIKGKKTEEPCYYIAVSAKGIEVGGGMYDVSKENLHKIRQEILYNSEGLKQILNSKDFKKYFKGIYGKKNVVLPKEYKEIAQENPVIYQQQYYIFTEFDYKEAMSDDFVKKVLKIFEKVKPFNDYLWEAILD